MNILYEKFPNAVVVNGKSYPVETDFREWIRFQELVDDDTVPWQIKCRLLLRWYTKQVPPDIESAIYALGEFLICKKEEEHEDERQGPAEPVFSFTEDAGCIYAAFREAYGIDLQKVTYMHWWEFRALFDWLPEDTEIKQRILYRGTDVNSIPDKNERKRVRRIQEAITLKKKRRVMTDYEIGDVFS